MKLYILDSSQAFRDALARHLESIAGVEVVGADTPSPDAVGRVLAADPAMVIVNPALPFHAGLGIVGTLRRRRRGMRIVVVGNSANAGYRDRALRAGAEAYVDQSADLERLLELLPPVARRPGPRGDPS